MKHPILLNIKKQFPDVIITHKAPANCTYRVAFAQVTHFKNDNFDIIEQDYDAKDAYISLVEIRTKTHLQLDITCTHQDLYWLYQLKHAIQFKNPTKGNVEDFSINEKEYRIIYASHNTYTIRFTPGHYLTFFYVLDGDWFLRQPNDFYIHFKAFKEYIREKTRGCKVSKPLFIHYNIIKHLVLLLNAKVQDGIVMETDIYGPIAQLFNISHEDKKARLPIKNTSLLLATLFREIIIAQIQEGEVTNLQEIANSLDVSVGYLRKIHIEHFNISSEKFFMDEKMKEAMNLLKHEDYSVKNTAYRLGYSHHSSLYKPFKKKFGISPKEVIDQRIKKNR